MAIPPLPEPGLIDSPNSHGPFFDLWSKFYDATPVLSSVLRTAQRLAIERLSPSPGERILDLGGGPGRGSASLLARDCEVVLADYSSGMIDRARAATHGRAAIVRADAGRLPFASGSFDGVLCTNAFHHFPDAAAALREMHRVLRPGGRVSLVDPAEETLASRIAIYVVEKRIFRLDEVHLHDEIEWRQLLREAGFHEVLVDRGPWYLPFMRNEVLVLAYA